MSTVATLTIEMAANVARLQADMAQAKRTVDGAMGQIQRSAQMAQRALAAIGVGLSVQSFANFIKQSIDAADALDELSQKTGITTRELGGLQLAFKASGLQADALVSATKKLSVAAVENSSALTGLGVSARNADGSLKSNRQLLGEVADAFAKTQDGAIKTANAVALFGKSGSDLIPVLNAGAAGLAEFDSAAQKLGLTIDSETAAAAGKFNDTIDLLKSSGQAFGTQIAAQLLPTMQNLAGMFLESAKSGGAFQVVADAISVTMRGLYVAGIAVSEVFTQVGNTLGGVAAAVAFAAQGQFKMARDALALMSQDNVQSFKDAAARIEQAWNGAGNATVQVVTQGVKATGDYTQAVHKAADAVDRVAEAERKRRDGIAIDLADQRMLVEMVRAGNDADEARLRIQLARKGLTGDEIEQSVQLKAQLQELLDIRKQAADEAEAEIKAQNEYLKKQQEALDAVPEQVRSMAQEVSTSQRIFDDIGRSLTDSLFRGFESGKGFAKNFRDSVVNLFRTTLIRIPLQGVLTSITGAIGGMFGMSGSAQAAGVGSGGFGGGLMNGLSGAKTVFDALSGSMSTSLGSFATYLGNAGFSSGASFVNGFASALNGGSAANFAGASSAYNLGNFAGQAAPFLPGVISAFQGDFKTAAFQTAGAAIGSAVGGPIGGAIGSAIGTMISGLVGTSGGTPHKGGTFGVSADAGRILDGRNLSGAKNKGFTDAEFGKIRSASTGVSAVGDALKPVLQQFAASLSALTQTNIKVAAGIGADGEDASQAFFRVTEAGKQLAYNVTEFSKDLKKGAEQFAKFLQGGALAFAVQQSSAEQFVKDAFGQFDVSKKDKLGNTVIDAKKAAGLDPAAVQAVAQAVNALRALSPALASLNVTAAQVVAAGKDAGTLSANTAALQALLTPQELVTAQTDTLAAQFKALGLSLPSSAQGLRDLVTGIDKSTESGQKLFGSVLGLVQPFLQLQQAIESVNGSAQAATEALMQQAIAGASSRDDALRRLGIVQNGGVLPAFASGGDFGGGVALVGERGPEIISTGPARIFNAQQTSQMLSANDGSAEEVRALREDLRASQTAIASLQSRMVRLFERWDSTGLPEVRTL